jgi:superfamily II DNA or RNA helicase
VVTSRGQLFHSTKLATNLLFNHGMRYVHFARQSHFKLTPKSALDVKPSPEISKFVPRDYQVDCVQSTLKWLDEGHRRIANSIATGGGKTVSIDGLLSIV